MSVFLSRHAQNALAALGQLSRQPIATALTVLVIGIALALPAGLQVLVQSAQRLAGNWQDIRDFSVYLRPGTPLTEARALVATLGKRDGIASVRLVTADEALAEFRRDPAFGEVLELIEGNPLPHTLVLRPGPAASAAEIAALRTELAARPEVDLVQVDTEWLTRLAAILDTVRRAVTTVAVLLVAAVIVIVGNTIRLDIQNRRQEIEVTKLLGADDRFVRRPFLYIGFWYGTFGGLVALAVLGASLAALAGPLQRLGALYGVEIAAPGLTLPTVLLVFGGGILAGAVGAWTAVARHLSAIEPRV
jgi:cell division transport system permease protein